MEILTTDILKQQIKILTERIEVLETMARKPDTQDTEKVFSDTELIDLLEKAIVKAHNDCFKNLDFGMNVFGSFNVFFLNVRNKYHSESENFRDLLASLSKYVEGE